MSTTRLPAEARRASLLTAACGLFAARSFRGTTTADIARAAGVTEPVLYRHFPSKCALYLACMDWTWEQVKELWAERLADEPDPALWLAAIGRAFIEAEAEHPLVSPMWVRALAESSEDEKIAAYMRGHMREVHDYVAGVISRAQAAGGIDPERDPDAEAWIFIALGLLSMADEVVGTDLQDTWPAIRESRIAWLRGSLHPA
ncbi:MAG TPA: TetR/AcrR family transcriptional regulator [Gaiellaceae bacterium]|jgi:AcrR family transcriptional regulator